MDLLLNDPLPFLYDLYVVKTDIYLVNASGKPPENHSKPRSTTPPLELLPKEERLKLAAEGYAVPLDDIKIDKVTFS